MSRRQLQFGIVLTNIRSQRMKVNLVVPEGAFVDIAVMSNRVFHRICIFRGRHVLGVRGSIVCRGVSAGGKRVDKHRESSGLDGAHH